MKRIIRCLKKLKSYMNCTYINVSVKINGEVHERSVNINEIPDIMPDEMSKSADGTITVFSDDMEGTNCWEATGCWERGEISTPLGKNSAKEVSPLIGEPTVTAHVPLVDAADVLVGANIEVTFSEPMDTYSKEKNKWEFSSMQCAQVSIGGCGKIKDILAYPFIVWDWNNSHAYISDARVTAYAKASGDYPMYVVPGDVFIEFRSNPMYSSVHVDSLTVNYMAWFGEA